jgi:hypothetical protein
MALRPLTLGPDERQRIAHLVGFARDPVNWLTRARLLALYVPGDYPEYVLTLHTYRCVFTWTEGSKGTIFRQLSVSVPGGKLPNIYAAFTLATAFGLTGWQMHSNGKQPPADWMVYPGLGSVAMAQKIPGVEVEAARHGAPAR